MEEIKNKWDDNVIEISNQRFEDLTETYTKFINDELSFLRRELSKKNILAIDMDFVKRTINTIDYYNIKLKFLIQLKED